MYKITYPDFVSEVIKNLLTAFNETKKATMPGRVDDLPEIPIGEIEFYLGKETGDRLLAIREKNKRIAININRIIPEITTCDMYWPGTLQVAARMLRDALNLKTDENGTIDGTRHLLYIDRFLRDYLGTMYGLTQEGRKFQEALNKILEWIMHMAHSLLENDDRIAVQESVDVPELEQTTDGNGQC